ncbi:hypothetical protein BG015_004898 [Linnemannia schmuckeri]|uniref:Uncharacterized protein n=1 Tax=Linnemannia schmuckeri TaxID=64567 RepID=A0A9P5RAW2_9FUNG|nr:hypothetical protein BG015_004898 [Linnemannia schmuckeri]
MTVPGNRHAGEVLHAAASAEMYHQHFACPAASSIEPAKAAIIDNWRRSLHVPLLVEDAASSHVDESSQQQQQQPQMRARANDQDLADLHGPSLLLMNSRDLETTLKRSSLLGLDMAACNNTESGGLHSATIVPSPITDLTLTHWANNAHENNSYAKNDNFTQVHQENHHHHQAQDDIFKRLSIIAGNNRSSAVAKEEDELPLGLLQANRLKHPRGATAPTNSLAPAARLDDNSNLCYLPIPVSSSATSSKIERAPFTVHVPIRQLRQCSSIPSSSVNITINKPKYTPIDTTPYTTISSSLPHHPPPRPPRPPSVGFNSLAGPDELNAIVRPIYDININNLNNNNNNNKNGPSQNNNNSSPPLPSPANYTRKHSQNCLSLSRSISAKSTQALQPQQQQDFPVHPFQTARLPIGGDDNEDEDEPLALTLSRQQSFRQRQSRSQIMKHHQQQQQPPIPVPKGTLAASESISQLPVSHLQCYEQVTPAASNESVSY